MVAYQNFILQALMARAASPFRRGSIGASIRYGDAPPPASYSHRIVKGVRIHCAEMGVETGATPVVLLHGLGDSHLTWTKIGPELARHRRVLIPDLPGHGLSDRPDASYKLAWYTQIMSQWLCDLGLESVDIIGHSLGGGIAQMMLLECRQRIRRMGLLASGGLGREIAAVLRLASLPYVVEHLGQPFMQLGTQLAMRLARDGRTGDDIGTSGKLNAEKGTARAFARTVQDLMDLRAQRHTFYNRVHEVSDLPPIRVYWGEKDSIIPILHGRTFEAHVAGVRLVAFESCGHFLHHQKPSLVAQALQDFLDEVDPPAARYIGAGRRVGR